MGLRRQTGISIFKEKFHKRAMDKQLRTTPNLDKEEGSVTITHFEFKDIHKARARTLLTIHQPSTWNRA